MANEIINGGALIINGIVYGGADGGGNDNKLDASVVASTYDASITYFQNDYCYYNGKLYKCILQCADTTPPNTTYWEEVTVMTAINNAILGAMGGSY